MLTDAPPRQSSLVAFSESDRRRTIRLPEDSVLQEIAESIETAMEGGTTTNVHSACQEFLKTASHFYRVPQCSIRVLSARPLRVRENWASELFGDYAPDIMQIRVWMRTAIKRKITSSGTFLSTLCHEFCHHLTFNEKEIGGEA